MKGLKTIIPAKGESFAAHQADNLRQALGLSEEDFEMLEERLTKLRKLQDLIGRMVWVDPLKTKATLRSAISYDQINVALHKGRKREPWTGTIDEVRPLNDPKSDDVVMVPRVQHHISNNCRTGRVTVRSGDHVRVCITYGRQHGYWCGPANEVEIVGKVGE